MGLDGAMFSTGSHKSPVRLEETKELEREIKFLKYIEDGRVLTLPFESSTDKLRSVVFDQIMKGGLPDLVNYEFPSFQDEKFLLENPDKAPEFMKQDTEERFYFYQRKTASAAPSWSYLTWHNGRFLRYIEVSGGFPWDADKDRIMVIAK